MLTASFGDIIVERLVPDGSSYMHAFSFIKQSRHQNKWCSSSNFELREHLIIEELSVQKSILKAVWKSNEWNKLEEEEQQKNKVPTCNSIVVSQSTSPLIGSITFAMWYFGATFEPHVHKPDLTMVYCGFTFFSLPGVG